MRDDTFFWVGFDACKLAVRFSEHRSQLLGAIFISNQIRIAAHLSGPFEAVWTNPSPKRKSLAKRPYFNWKFSQERKRLIALTENTKDREQHKKRGRRKRPHSISGILPCLMLIENLVWFSTTHRWLARVANYGFCNSGFHSSRIAPSIGHTERHAPQSMQVASSM